MTTGESQRSSAQGGVTITGLSAHVFLYVTCYSIGTVVFGLAEPSRAWMLYPACIVATIAWLIDSAAKPNPTAAYWMAATLPVITAAAAVAAST